MKIVIVGAGIGGLAAALSLHAAGFHDVVVHERVRELRPLGVGINLLPHAVRELTELGLGERVAAIGVPPRTPVVRQPLRPARSGASRAASTRATGGRSYSVHRGELQLLLAREVGGPARLGRDPARAAIRRRRASRSDRDRAVHGCRGRESAVEADLLIGADGIHSAVRRAVYPDEGAPPWNGLVLWRGTAIVPAVPRRSHHDHGRRRRAEVRRLPDRGSGTDSGMSRINFIAERRAPDGVGETADWNRPVDAAPIVELFADWRFDWLDVPGVIAAADEILEYPMVDRDPLPHWTFGRTTLIGDAAHAMYPNGSNGASQAIIDARTLAFELATRPTVDDALEAYEAERRPATARLHEMTRQLGPERVMQLAHDRAPDGFDDIDDVIPLAEREQIAADYKLAAGFHPERLNERVSLTPPAASVTGSPSIASRRRVVATT